MIIDHDALLAKIAEARENPGTMREFAPGKLYEQDRSMLQYADNRNGNGPAVLVTPEAVTSKGKLRCTTIVHPHPQLTSLPPARGACSARAVRRAPVAV